MTEVLFNPYRLASSFDPSTITGLQVWLKADGTLWQDSARTTAVASDGDPVGAWDDASAQANHVLQATSTKRPLYKAAILNGKPVVRFDATDDYLAKVFTALAQPNTIFYVGSIPTANGYAFDSTDNGQRQAMGDGVIAGGQVGLYAGGVGVSAAWTRDSTVRIWQALFNGASSAIRRSGGSAFASGGAGSQAMHGLTVGNDWSGIHPAGADVAELLVYNASLSLANLDLIGNYLASKYGVTWTAAA